MDYTPKLGHVIGCLLLGCAVFIGALYWERAAAVLRITGMLAWLLGVIVTSMLVSLTRPIVLEQTKPERIPEPGEVRVRLTDERQGGYHQSIFDLPARYDQLTALADGLQNGLPFSERVWTGAGRPFSVNEFKTLRAALIQRNCLAPASDKDARQGYTLTVVGQHLLREFAPADGSPTPGLHMLPQAGR